MNKTAQDAMNRINPARRDSLRDASPEYLDMLERQVASWLENIRDVRQATAVDDFDLSDTPTN